MKILLITMVSIWLFLPLEPDLVGVYASTPFERCEEAYRGSELIKTCDILK